MRQVSTWKSMNAWRSVGGTRSRADTASGRGCPTERSPVVDMIEHSERTRSGWSMASCWTIMPPIETPTTWAAAIPRASSRPAASDAMSATR